MARYTKLNKSEILKLKFKDNDNNSYSLANITIIENNNCYSINYDGFKSRNVKTVEAVKSFKQKVINKLEKEIEELHQKIEIVEKEHIKNYG